MQPVLILVHGAPGVGKATLARKLARDLNLPQLGKDDLKEFFYDTLGTGDREWSRTLGAAVSNMLYPLTEALVRDGHSFILESAFWQSFATPEFERIVREHNVRCLEIYCTVDEAERRRRFIARNESGQRHKGHVDAVNYDTLDATADGQKYAPLHVGELHSVDTTHFGEPEYAALLRYASGFMGR